MMVVTTVTLSSTITLPIPPIPCHTDTIDGSKYTLFCAEHASASSLEEDSVAEEKHARVVGWGVVTDVAMVWIVYAGWGGSLACRFCVGYGSLGGGLVRGEWRFGRWVVVV